MTADIVRPLRSLLARRPAERRLVVETLVVVATVRLALSVVPYPMLRRLRRPALRLARLLGTRAGDEAALVRALGVAARHVPAASCLTQAIALHLLLARRGAASDLVVGVTRRAGAFEAHAWVERDGRVLIGGDVEPYRPLLRVGPEGR